MTTPSDSSTSSRSATRSWSMLTLLEAVSTLQTEGGVICFKLESRFVLACRAYDELAVQKINLLKKRREGRPLVLAFSNLKSAENARLNSPLLQLLQKFKDQLTVSIPAPPALPTPAHRGMGLVGVRILTTEPAQTLLNELGEPLLLSSANPTGQPSAQTLEELHAYQMSDLGVIGSEEINKVEQERRATVVRLVDSHLKILSQGDLSLTEIEEEWERLRLSGAV